MTTVHNVRDGRPADLECIFIGRPSIFGNPFSLRAMASQAERAKCLSDFRVYFLERVGTDPGFRNACLRLRGLALLCYCKPARCHGDIIAEWIDGQPEVP